MEEMNIRRKDRIMDAAETTDLLKAGEYGFMSMADKDAGGYGIPLSYAYDADGRAIYIHCAMEGRKLDNLKADNRVTFCVVGKTNVMPDQFSTAYESAIAFGTAELELSEEERRKALWLIVDKYSPEFKKMAEMFIEKSFHRTAIIRIDVKHVTGKAKTMR